VNSTVSYPVDRAAAIPAEFVRKVFAWMFAGLALTGVAALYTAGSPALLKAIFGNKMVFYALVFGELGLVIAISGAINRLSAAAATGLFLLYSALNGVTLASIFLVYTGGSIAATFFVSASTFGAMSAYGYLTKKDLTSWGSFLFMGLIGVVIASLVNMFLNSPMVAWVASVCGVIVFVGLTAYDTQKIKALGAAGFSDESAQRKASILGALTLYLDFINIFLMLLNLFGRRR
jgi:FtsH-binding integral membrane protein